MTEKVPWNRPSVDWIWSDRKVTFGSLPTTEVMFVTIAMSSHPTTRIATT